MAETARTLKVTYAEYLAAERSAEVKHEFLDGEIYAMSGGRPEHGLLAGNMIRLLGNHLLDRPSVVYTSDVRVRIEAVNVGTYPDVSVVCGPVVPAVDDSDAITNPVLLVEVLSDSTERYDRGEKFGFYQRIPSLLEYVLVSQHRQRVEVYRRTEGKHWDYAEYEAGDSVTLASIQGELAVNEIYRKVTLPETAGTRT